MTDREAVRFTAHQVARMLRSVGVTPDGAASIIGQSVERAWRPGPRCPACGAPAIRGETYTDCTDPKCGGRSS